jgi:hypothetical protein
MAGGIGGALSDIFGGQSDYRSNVQGPDRSLFYAPDQHDNRVMMQRALNSSGVTAPQLGFNAGAQQEQSRDMQMSLANQLQQQAAGQGPSVAGQQLQQGLQQQLLQQRAQAASMGGDVNPFLAQRQLSDQGAQAQQATNAQMAMARTQEQMNAQGALGGLTGQMRGMDQNVAAMAQQSAVNNAQLYQQQQQINNQAAQYAMSGLTGLSAQQLQANMGYAGMQNQTDLANNQVNAGVAGQNAANANAYGAALVGGAAQGLSAKLASDERVKEHVERNSVDSDMREFLAALDPASYDYKVPEKHGEGRHWSVMAQSAEKSRAGRSFVFDAPDGVKMLDTRKATGVALAALSHLHRRQDKLETLAQKALRRG